MSVPLEIHTNVFFSINLINPLPDDIKNRKIYFGQLIIIIIIIIIMHKYNSRENVFLLFFILYVSIYGSNLSVIGNVNFSF